MAAMHATRRAALAIALLAALPLGAQAAPFGPPVPTEVLDRVRGGYSAADGTLRIAFGIERTVALDGALVAAQRLVAPHGAVALQNTLDGQHIRTVTTIDVQVNSLQVLNGLRLHGAIGAAIAESLRR